MNEENIIKKYEKKYIVDLDLKKIEWIKLNPSELEIFLEENYYDEENRRYITDNHYSPLGLHYLRFKPHKEHTYILGVTPNNIGKKTILVALIYMDKYYRYAMQTVPLTYLITIETNQYYQKHGLFNLFCENLINFINPNQHILATRESETGSIVHVIDREKLALLEHGFTKNIWINDEHLDWNLDFYNTVCPEYPKKSFFKR